MDSTGLVPKLGDPTMHVTLQESRKQSFVVDNGLVTKHMTGLKAYDDKVVEILEERQVKTDWQQLFTHPKLMS